jgi:hypothetical protein
MKNSRFYQKELKVNTLKHPEKYKGSCDTICIRSSWEYSMVKFFDKNANVLEWNSEGVIIPYFSPIDKQKHNYFVDFYVKVIDKKEKIREWLLEIKPYNETIKPDIKSSRKKSTNMESIKRFVINQAKWASAKEFCQRNNMRFRVITERDVPM